MQRNRGIPDQVRGLGETAATAIGTAGTAAALAIEEYVALRNGIRRVQSSYRPAALQIAKQVVRKIFPLGDGAVHSIRDVRRAMHDLLPFHGRASFMEQQDNALEFTARQFLKVHFRAPIALVVGCGSHIHLLKQHWHSDVQAVNARLAALASRLTVHQDQTSIVQPADVIKMNTPVMKKTGATLSGCKPLRFKKYGCIAR